MYGVTNKFIRQPGTLQLSSPRFLYLLYTELKITKLNSGRFRMYTEETEHEFIPIICSPLILKAKTCMYTISQKNYISIGISFICFYLANALIYI